MTLLDVSATQFFATSDGKDLATDATFDVINPSTGQVFAQAPSVTPEQLDVVFAAANRAYRDWKRDEGLRRTVLLAAAVAVEAAVDELAPILVAEQGKPLGDAR
ncbi:MAG TPA: aldehyde dehydrogenase family protein, partial [Microbacteriaceae bacterium]|nr:aldehyde dehydrogenase family protein [Microbacteriaceae bacterium]